MIEHVLRVRAGNGERIADQRTRSRPASRAPASSRESPYASTGPSAPEPVTECRAAHDTKDAVKSYPSGPARFTSDTTRPDARNASATTQERPPEVGPAPGPGTSDATRSPTTRIVGTASGTRFTKEPTS